MLWFQVRKFTALTHISNFKFSIISNYKYVCKNEIIDYDVNQQF